MAAGAAAATAAAASAAAAAAAAAKAAKAAKAAMAGAAAAEAVSDWTVREDVRIADAFREARLQVVAARRRAAAVAASIARMQERGSTGMRVVAMAVVAAAEEAEAEVAEAAEAAGHLLQTRLRARETHARAHTAWQGEPVGEDSGETPSWGWRHGERALSMRRALSWQRGSRGVWSGRCSPGSARGLHASSAGGGAVPRAGPSGALHEHVCARRRSVGRSPSRADVGFGAECTPCTRIASTTSQSRPAGMASPDDDGRRVGAEERVP